MSFEATCTGCGEAEVLTSTEADALVDPRGYFLCEQCRADGKAPPAFKRRRRSRAGKPQADRRLGCIVTAMLPDGTLMSYTEAGKTTEALETICSRLPDGSHVETVSTYRTIIADLKNSRRRDNHDRLDPWASERVMLAKIGRLDLLPERARGTRPRSARGGR
jgi:hypothetical protein